MSNELDCPGIPPAPVFGLDPTRVGEALIRLGAASVLMGHDSIFGTAEPYLSNIERVGGSPEAVFVADILRRNMEDVAGRWYGGVDEACRMAATILEMIHG